MRYVNHDQASPALQVWQGNDSTELPALDVRTNSNTAPALRLEGPGNLLELFDADGQLVFAVEQDGSTGGTGGGGVEPGSVTNASVASNAAISADKLANGTTNVVMTATERTKLTGIAAGAGVSQAQSTIVNLVTDLAGKAPTTHNHTAAQITSGTIVAARLPADNIMAGTAPTVADAAGDPPTGAEYNALLSALRTRGVIA